MHPIKPHSQAGGTIMTVLIALVVMTVALLAVMQKFNSYAYSVRALTAQREFNRMVYELYMAISNEAICARTSTIGTSVGLTSSVYQQMTSFSIDGQAIMEVKQYPEYSLEITEMELRQEVIPMGSAPQRTMLRWRIKAHTIGHAEQEFERRVPYVGVVDGTGTITHCYRRHSMRVTCEEMGRTWNPEGVPPCSP